MKEYVTDYQNFVSQKQAEYNDSVKTLKADAREDEANLFKVRANICDVFYKMIAATDKKVTAMKICDKEEYNRIFDKEYLSWFDSIPENWRINLALAKKHDNLIVVKTEEVKLDTAMILRDKFLELAERRSIDND
jgi:hypothetical protein